MPTYSFEVLGEDGEVEEILEITQPMSAPLPTEHPESGKALRRIFYVPNVAFKYTESQTKNRLSDKNLDRMGFTKYKNEGGGIYRRTAGKEGPEFIDKNKGGGGVP